MSKKLASLVDAPISDEEVPDILKIPNPEKCVSTIYDASTNEAQINDR